MSEEIASPPAANEQTARYLYCVVPESKPQVLGSIGIEGQMVYAVACEKLAALVHDCPPQPYQSQDDEIAGAWVLAHHRVVDAAWKRWGTVLPLRFNTIIVAERSGIEAALTIWLRNEYVALQGKLDSLRGKAEYGVQVFWDPQAVSKIMAQTDPEIVRLKEEIAPLPRGAAYMYRQKLERLLRSAVEARAQAEFTELYRAISACAEKVRVEKTKNAEGGGQMLLNLYCLVDGGKAGELERVTDAISARDNFRVRLAGPLPPYSFC